MKAKRLLSVLLAVLMVLAFMPAMGAGSGKVDTAKAMSIYSPTVDTSQHVIEIMIPIPYAGVTPDGIGSYTEVVHEVDETTIKITEEWKDADGNEQTAPLEKGKKYTYTVQVLSRTQSGDSAPDITKYDFSVVNANTGKEITWPGGSAEITKTGGGKTSRIVCTATFTAVEAPSQDLGAYKLYLTGGSRRVTDRVTNASIRLVMDKNCDFNFLSQDYDYEADLDKDGAFDIGATAAPDFSYCDYVKLPGANIKTRITLNMPASEKLKRDRNDIPYYGSVVMILAKSANPLKIKAKTATVKYKKLKKKTQKLAVTKVIKFVKKGKGDMAYKLVSVKKVKSKAKVKKYFKIASKTGKVTVKKGLKKGTYKVKVKVKAAGNTDYEASKWKTVTFKVKVK